MIFKIVDGLKGIFDSVLLTKVLLRSPLQIGIHLAREIVTAFEVEVIRLHNKIVLRTARMSKRKYSGTFAKSTCERAWFFAIIKVLLYISRRDAKTQRTAFKIFFRYL